MHREGGCIFSNTERLNNTGCAFCNVQIRAKSTGCAFCNVQGTWEHGNRQGQCRIEKNHNGVAFIDGNYQDNKMNGKVYTIHARSC